MQPTKVLFTNPLRPQDATSCKEVDAEHAIGGMRNPWRSINRLSRMRSVGAKVRALLDKCLDLHPGLVERCVAAIGSDTATGPTEAELKAARAGLARLLGASSSQPLDAATYNCTLCGPILEAWA